MVDCCSPGTTDTVPPSTRRCPKNGIEYHNVSVRTLVHHLKQPWRWHSHNRNYYFCADPGCDVVYFSEDGEVILKSQIRTLTGMKEAPNDALVCYCFGITMADTLINPGLKDFIIEQTKLGLCSCETSNPSGRCCLKDFPHDSHHA
ncbi:MAG: hypothetical protein KZQ95_12570 [Candidatus Thiodiazotropha sp. (ex Epidulcina cf. delphinae)]|nr:hypothetical protein [Candidatus Thiodiazotropha sp. (ex Epidulcina cf. delphinae)]